MEKKKRRPNWIDILFIVLILAVVLVAYMLIHGGDRTDEVVRRSYVVELTNLRADMADCVSVGDSVTDNVKNYDMGIVTDVTVTPYTVAAMDEEAGFVRMTEVPDRITLEVTIEVDTTENEKQISTVSGYDLRIGTSVSCTIDQLTASGYIIGMSR